MKKTNGGHRCRLCACEKDLNSLSDIFDSNFEYLAIESKINKLLPIVVMPWDPMPHKICHWCLEKLNAFEEFYDNCLKAENVLQALHFSASQRKRVRTFDPVDEVLKPPIPDNASTATSEKKIPENNNRQSPSPGKPEGVPETPETVPETAPKRTRSDFVIHEITSKDCIFTCRQCFRTYTKESSALNHNCVETEKSQSQRTMDENQKKSLPPFKIRLFSMKCGVYVCCVCQASFNLKSELVSHIKRHFGGENMNEEENENVMNQRKKRRDIVEEEEPLDVLKKRRSNNNNNNNNNSNNKALARKRGRRMTVDATTGRDTHCSLGTATKEKMESIGTQSYGVVECEQAAAGVSQEKIYQVESSYNFHNSAF